MNYLQKKPPLFIYYLLAPFLFLLLLSSCTKELQNTPSEQTDLVRLNSVTSKTSAAVQTARAGIIVSEHIHGFYEYLPNRYSNDITKQYPLLICLHGIGQVGNGTTDLPGLLQYGPAMYINNGTFPTSFTVDGKAYSMIVITPQLTEVGMFPNEIDSLLEYCKTNYRIDTNRVYLAGLSIGGANVWHYAGYSAATASKITAMVPICAWTTPDYNYQVTQDEAQTVANANIKIWQTHCYDDPTAMFSWSVNQADMVRGYSAPGSVAPKLTSFNSNSHDAWTTTYAPSYKESGMNIYQWMLHYEKGTVPAPIVQKVPFNQVITIKGANDFYLHNNNDGSPLFLNSTSYTLWEGYTVVSVTASKVALLNQGHYVTKLNPNNVSCTATSISSQETFLWIYNTDGTVSFQSNNGKYISNNNGLVTCLATSIGINEKFWINR